MDANSSTLRWIISFSFWVSSLIIMGVGLPLWRQKVPPNPIAGFRTAKTLADPDLWYFVNAVTGRNLFILGCIVFCMTVVLHFTVSQQRPFVSALILSGVLAAGALAVAFHGWTLTR